MRTQKLALVACDWNGTLVDDARRGLRATNAVLEAHSFPSLTMVGFRASFCLPLHEYLARLGISSSEMENAVTQWNDEVARIPCRLRAGVHALLDVTQQRGANVGVISGARRDVVVADADSFGITERLAFVDGDVDVKSDHLAALVGESNGDVFYIGDTEHDIGAAVHAGATAIAVSGGYRPVRALRRAGATFVCRDLSLFATHLAQLYKERTAG